MRDLLSRGGFAMTWFFFFATSVYGHVALKQAVETRRTTVAAALSGWGISAFIAWTLSGVLWMLVLSKHSLLKANSISSLRYVFICAAAWAIWRTDITARTAIGIAAIAAGVYLVAR
jgi:drug/metabolite transporter (DMT)-like permease